MKSNTTTTAPLSAIPPPPPAEELLTQVQLARRLGISRRTLASWVRNKTVPMIKIAGFCRFDFAKVRAALEQHEQAAASNSSSSQNSTL